MTEIELKEVESQLAKVNIKIAELRDKFWGNFEWNDEKTRLEAEIETNQEWKTKLEASKETIIVMSNGGITANIKAKVDCHKKLTYMVDLTRSERSAGRIGFVS